MKLLFESWQRYIKESPQTKLIPVSRGQTLIVIMGPPGCGNCRRALFDIKRVAGKLGIPWSVDMRGDGRWARDPEAAVLKIAIHKWDNSGPAIYVSGPGKFTVPTNPGKSVIRTRWLAR